MRSQQIPKQLALLLGIILIIAHGPQLVYFRALTHTQLGLDVSLAAIGLLLLLEQKRMLGQAALILLSANLFYLLYAFSNVASPILLLTNLTNPRIIISVISLLLAWQTSVRQQAAKVLPTSLPVTEAKTKSHLDPRTRQRIIFELTAVVLIAGVIFGIMYVQPRLIDRDTKVQLANASSRIQTALHDGKNPGSMPNGIQYYTTTTGYALCATFLTDATRPSLRTRKYNDPYTQADIETHAQGRQCFAYQYTYVAKDAVKYDSSVLKNQIITTISGSKIATIPIEIGQSAISSIDLSLIKVVDQNDQTLDKKLLKPGNVISLYWEEDRLKGASFIYKLKIESSTLKPSLCEVILLHHPVTPVAACSATTHNLTIAKLLPPTSVELKTASGIQVIVYQNNLESLTSKAKVGDRINLIYDETSGALTSIQPQ